MNFNYSLVIEISLLETCKGYFSFAVV